MVVPKTSRKGKKAWRRNIDTKEIEHALELRTEEERKGTGVSSLDDQHLFFVDKAGDKGAAQTTGLKLRRRPKEKKLLRCQVILQAAHLATPVSQPVIRKKKGNKPKEQTQAQAQVTGKQQQQAALVSVVAGPRSSSRSDPWDGYDDVSSSGRDDWTAVRDSQKPGTKAVTRKAPRPLIAPVEVDKAGCSMNPDPELHQDAIAEAVAVEMQSIYAKEFQRSAPPATVDYQPTTDELELLQVDAETDDDDERQGNGDDDDEQQTGAKHRATERKSTRDLNRKKRRLAMEKEEAARKALKKQRRELDALKLLQAQVEEEENQKQRRAQRRQAIKSEKEREQPPRLGKHVFTPEPPQVLLTEEVSGSLRKLKPTVTVVRDRYKSLQKRGIVEPRKRVQKKVGKKIEYVHGRRGEADREGMKELKNIQARRKALKKAKA